MDKIRVLSYGIGVVGAYIAKSLVERDGVEIVGVIDIAKDKIGKDLGEILGTKKRFGVEVSNDIDAVVSKVRPDVAIHATSSYLKDTFPQIVSIVKRGVNVISTCEELSYPYRSAPKLAKDLDSLAKQYDVTVLGTGINPGFLMDALVITLTAPCQTIEKIQATRVMNAATRRLPFQKKIGAGLSVTDFNEKIKRKDITGHVGLEQSIGMIADALAWKLDKIIVEPAEAIVARKPVESKDIKVKPGSVAGLKQRAKGVVRGVEVIVLDFSAYLGAEEEYDAVTIKGVPEINERIAPCVHGDFGTVAMMVNSIPRVINAPSGLFTMKDLPIPSAAIGDMRKYIRVV